MINYFERKIRLKDFEVWDLRIAKRNLSLFILDEHRPATLEDFEMPELIYEEGDQRVNYVSAKYYSKEVVLEEHKEILGEFARMLTEHLALAHCEVIIKFYQENPKKALDRIMLAKYGFKESEIPLKKLWHFNQE
ncbi:hypothetical protein MKY29_11110 [Psychrobacillus sp. FSL K6-2365]|uniref:hypothetical protein n=1 Tax=Psychrobacillus TaxID=1221880 RepID=UPI0008ECF80A|nr:hypothetical protein [Psychrobacillus psychrodurans]MCZ8541843.1 hypothetical protein [Psychrobacillus psychrodurans]SFN12033.1 hypothetical protein SAMN05421832_11567 [Psychrobacillus psychrodurans]